MNLRKDHYRAKQSALTDTGVRPVDVLVRGFASISAKCGKARDTSASPSLVVIIMAKLTGINRFGGCAQ